MTVESGSEPAEPNPSTPSDLIVPVGSRETVVAVDDPFSDRLRIDHPETEDGEALAEALVEVAEDRGRGRIVALVPSALENSLSDCGFQLEGVMPGFYEGQRDCSVMGLAVDNARSGLANPLEVARVDAILEAPPPERERPVVDTRRAELGDAEPLAELIAETFSDYPTPSHDPGYLANQIREGTPFRLVEDSGELVACASADLVVEAKTAELTDCATRPSHRGRGLMKSILNDLMGDLEALDFPTAFTLARARIVGVNLAFQRLGFTFRGRMVQSCRIGDGIEDMNIWSRSL